MLRILAALVVATAILAAAVALAGTAVQTRPAQVTTLLGPDKGALRPAP